MNYIKFDVMKPIGGGDELFVATMRYPHDPVFKLNIKAMYEWILDKRSSLKGQTIRCYFYDNTNTVLQFN